MSHYTRAQTGLRPARSTTPLTNPIGIALHWPAMTRPVRGVAAVKAALRGWQAYHMDTHGWSDIAYQAAVDQDGHVYALRGLSTRPGANGDTSLNEAYGALLLILAPGEQPSPAMIEGVRWCIAETRRRFPRALRIVGHGDIRPGGTECPGPAVRAAIAARTFHTSAFPTPPPEPPRNKVQTARNKIRTASKLLGRTDRDRAEAHRGAGVLRRLLRRLPKR